jgi:hypothetical protein
MSLTDAQTAANSHLTTVVSLQQQYTLLQDPQRTNMDEIRELDGQLEQEMGTLKMLQIAEQTYTQEYLDRKNSPHHGGFFKRMGLGSVQNWSITVFFISYVFLFIVLLYTSMAYSREKLKMFAAVSMIGIIGLIVISQMLIAFG